MNIEQKLNRRAEYILKGATVREAYYMSKEDADAAGWYKRPLVIVLVKDDGTIIELCAQADDEGNDGGALSLYVPTAKEENDMAVLFGTLSR